MRHLHLKLRFVRVCFCLPLLLLVTACKPDAPATPLSTTVPSVEPASVDTASVPESATPKLDTEIRQQAPATESEPNEAGSVAVGDAKSIPVKADSKEAPQQGDVADTQERDEAPSAIAAVAPESTAPVEEHDPSVASPDQPDLPVDPSWKALTNTGNVWLDMKKKSVIVSGKICMREGQLEMFACIPHTKEYESLVVVDCPAFMVHGALLAVGAKAGSPVKFNPYQAANGSVIDVFVEWIGEDGEKRRTRAQNWIRHDKTGKPMEHDFVFGGSGLSTNEETGEQSYHAEGGELICVSNFSTATMDLPVRSPQDNQGLWFSTFTNKIPKLETKIHLILVPRK